MVDDVRQFVRTRSALVPVRVHAGFPGVYRPITDADTSPTVFGAAEAPLGGASGHRPQSAWSAGQEAEANRPNGVVRVRIEQADRLPGPQPEPPADDRNGQ